MPALSVKNRSGADAGSVDIDERIFGIEPNVPVMHQVVTAQLAARRAGTQSTKTRAEVRGGGAKPWKQKGTGRARQGSIRAPHWRGGGVALGPKPRDYSQRTPKKMIRLALRSALSDRFADGKVVVVDDWGFATPKTKDAVAALGALGVEGKVLVVLDGDDTAAWKSFRNLPNVHVLEAGQLNVYDVLVADYVVFTKATLPEAGDEAPRRERAEAPAPTPAKPLRPVKAAPAAAAEPDAAPEGDDVAADDLPTREKSTAEATKPVDPAERVKAAGEKADPRFEAARQKADKEDKLRQAMEAKVAAPEAGDDAATEGADAGEAAGGFSFNKTGEAS